MILTRKWARIRNFWSLLIRRLAILLTTSQRDWLCSVTMNSVAARDVIGEAVGVGLLKGVITLRNIVLFIPGVVINTV